jgi:hypothetical protein
MPDRAIRKFLSYGVGVSVMHSRFRQICNILVEPLLAIHGTAALGHPWPSKQPRSASRYACVTYTSRRLISGVNGTYESLYYYPLILIPQTIRKYG